eukprot:TRINITY_DN28745_c0_g1_i1.p1 TRINITY_DN28745_c0_g1~~TRINITY_DN28745_c0_g1_i1.p1  ORF type:complete len:321 (+),score=112.81 TRINITY_DN28745_c0_g1_i1:79-963(+)
MPEKDRKISKKRKAAAADGVVKRAKKPSANPAAVEASQISQQRRDGSDALALAKTPVATPAPQPTIDKALWATQGKPQVVFILESAGIAVTDLGRRKNQVLQHDKDGSFLDAKQQPTWLFRPDIVHQMLLAIFDMPLCKEGHVKVYINTIKQKAIEVSSTTRIPRTFKRFCGLVSQLIDQGKVVNPETDQPLFRVLNYPVRQNVPENAPVYGLCCSEVVDPVNAYSFVKGLPTARKGQPTGYFVIPCRDNAAWPDDDEGFGNYVTQKLCITQYETSPVTLIHKLSNAFERHWQV